MLKRAVNSVLNQSLIPHEIIVIDDGSTDETSKIKTIRDIKYFYKQNGGISSARNFGIKNSSADVIAFLDDDDEWDKDKLKLQSAFHEERNSFMSYTNECWIRNKQMMNLPKKFQKHSGFIFEKCLSHCFIAPSSVMINRHIFDEFGYFDENLEVCEDYDMWLKIASKYRIDLLDLPLIKKHAGHEEQLGFKHWGMDRFRVKSLLNIYALLKNETQKQAIKNELSKKINILLKGAKKHNNTKLLQELENAKSLMFS